MKIQMVNKKTLSLCIGLLCAIALDLLLLQVSPDKGPIPFYLFIFFFPYAYLFSIVCNSLEGIIYGIGLYSSAFLPFPAYVVFTMLAKSKHQVLLRIVVFFISHTLVAVTVIFMFQTSGGR
jgi:hypothetical protein